MNIKYITCIWFFAALGLWACKNEDEPSLPEPPKILPSELQALETIAEELGMEDEDYPVHWNLDDVSTWKGIELDTLSNEETGEKYVVIGSITVYLTKAEQHLPRALRDLTALEELKVYGCAGSYFHGSLVPETVTSLLVDRINPDDPGYIKGITNWEGEVVIANKKSSLNKLKIHGVDMKMLNCRINYGAEIVDLSYNTLEGRVPQSVGRLFATQANLSHNKYTVMDNWDWWMVSISQVPNVQYNLIEEFPEKVIESDFWKEYSDCFIGNPGYVAPQP